ncbi:S66 family peptidase [Shouchella lonarensis]|uniref:Muramoyltetrapeptide carboxypeptidase LdcA (Peptidoglycan recycling) n=1 Tax=Shouchella lonarensis TaxID=1464122 RepID=A0A1G6J520_9BACI|nr:S66 peptidase family protein [Shouchella lonarensis]SDC13811.1 Muramoyltetrapeptide carboxypeptidase LdcA (peptidoglycan recycling) [Shouchella lonarensis]
MIRYPVFQQCKKVAVTAPSSGVEPELHHLITKGTARMEERGFRVIVGDTTWTQVKAKSTPAPIRAAELQKFLQDEEIGLIMPPWGGFLLIEILPYLSFENISPKWILGYSDTSVLLLVLTLKTGIATAQGTNFVDVRGEVMDETTARFLDVLQTRRGEEVTQIASPFFQTEWQFDNPTPHIFHLTKQTEWKTISGAPFDCTGRLLGGCIDVIRHLIGTPFGDVAYFQQHFIDGEPILWHFENCDLKTDDLRRTLVQMRLAGWFDHCVGIAFGRSPANDPVEGYEIEDVYKDLSDELGVPVAYDLDWGHQPPQLTLVNGARARLVVEGGTGKLTQSFV